MPAPEEGEEGAARHVILMEMVDSSVLGLLEEEGDQGAEADVEVGEAALRDLVPPKVEGEHTTTHSIMTDCTLVEVVHRHHAHTEVMAGVGTGMARAVVCGKTVGCHLLPLIKDPHTIARNTGEVLPTAAQMPST